MRRTPARMQKRRLPGRSRLLLWRRRTMRRADSGRVTEPRRALRWRWFSVGRALPLSVAPCRDVRSGVVTGDHLRDRFGVAAAGGVRWRRPVDWTVADGRSASPLQLRAPAPARRGRKVVLPKGPLMETAGRPSSRHARPWKGPSPR